MAAQTRLGKIRPVCRYVLTVVRVTRIFGEDRSADHAHAGYASTTVQITVCSDGTYCCGQSNQDCCSRGLGYAIVNGKVVAASAASSQSLAPTQSSSSNPSSAKTTTTDAIAQPTSPPSTSASLTPSSPSSLSSAPSSSSPEPSKKSDSTVVGVGVGVGLGVGIPLIAAISALALVLSRRRTNGGEAQSMRPFFFQSKSAQAKVVELEGSSHPRVLAELPE
jgi:predicted extracellular nuclease